jgi:hypothetical protein
MTEKKLNLFEFTSRAMAQAGTGTTKIMRREMVNADPLGILPYCCPEREPRWPQECGTEPAGMTVQILHDRGTLTVRDNWGIVQKQ